MSRVLIGVAFVSVVLWLSRRRRDPMWTGAVVAYAFVALTPTLHPWYLLWAVPFLAVIWSRALVALSGLIVVSYHAAATAWLSGTWRETPGVWLLEFTPVVVLAAWDVMAARRRSAVAATAGRNPSSSPGRARERRRAGRLGSASGWSCHHALFGPPSPFRGRSSWQRFREDSWPKIATALSSFWHSGLRLPVLILILAGLGLAGWSSYRSLPAVAGRIVRAPDQPVAGAKVEVVWYVASREVVEEPRPRRAGLAVVEEESVLRSESLETDRDGRFRRSASWALAWPRSRGPFVRLRILAPDPISGKLYPVRRLRLADDSELIGAFDTSRKDLPRDWTEALTRIELPPPGRILDVAVSGERVATAEDGGGARLYRRTGEELEAVAHRPAERGESYRGVGFLDDDLVLFGAVGDEIVGPGLKTQSVLDRPYRLLLQASPTRLVVAGGGKVALLGRADPSHAFDSFDLGDPSRDDVELGPDTVRLVGALLLYQHSDGSIRLSDVDSDFRTPAMLSDEGGAAVDFDYLADGPSVLVASAQGITLYDVSRPEVTHKLARLATDIGPLAIRGLTVIGERGISKLAIENGQLVEALRIPVEASPTGAASAVVLGPRLVVPRVDEPQMRTVSTGLKWDSVLGLSREEARRLLDSVRLVGATVIDLGSGDRREVTLDPAERVVVRQDGLNRSLVAAVLSDTLVCYGTTAGRLRVVKW